MVFSFNCLYKAGEIDPFERYLYRLNNNQLYGLAYSYYDQPYKFYMTDKVMRPDVLALGSSRIMQVKRGLVKDEYSFYNAGGAVQNIYEFRLFLESLSYRPKLVLMNLDQSYFNKEYKDQTVLYSDSVYDAPQRDIHELFNIFRKFWTDLIKGRINLPMVYQTEDIGLSAIMKNCGFTADGSYWYGDLERQPEDAQDYNFKHTISLIEEKKGRFTSCEHADTSLIGELNKFLTYCERNKIKVIAMLPPFAPRIAKMLKEDDSYKYMDEVIKILTPLFDKYSNCHLIDRSDYCRFGDEYYLDGFHGSDLIYNEILAEIVDSISTVRQYFIPSDSIRSYNMSLIEQKVKYHSFNN